jgi:8-oxo-dGTP pyrophosphatase MutT (NUDIX family)
MPYIENQIRLITLALIKKDQKIFMSQGFDTVKNQHFYRAMGGGVDFGEDSLTALKREFREEINAEITNIRYLDCIENIFVYAGKPGHEIIQLYECDFADPQFYELEQISFSEGEKQKTALWIDIEKCKSGELRIVPEQFLNYL